MKLLVDVGNTTINLGLAEGDELVNSWRLHTNREWTADELFFQWQSMIGESFGPGLELTIASVVPELSRTIRRMARSRLDQDPYFLESPWEASAVSVETDYPDEVGADRVAGAEAMVALYGPGIVVDFGTATTIDFIDTSGNYRGGVIIPGFQAASRGLADETALLPSISPENTSEFGFSNTREALESGLVYGMAGSVGRIIDEFRDQGVSEEAPVVATGGGAELFLDICDEITDHAPELVLRGLLRIAGNQS